MARFRIEIATPVQSVDITTARKVHNAGLMHFEYTLPQIATDAEYVQFLMARTVASYAWHFGEG